MSAVLLGNRRELGSRAVPGLRVAGPAPSFPALAAGAAGPSKKHLSHPRSVMATQWRGN